MPVQVSSGRDPRVDFVKGVMIILMVLFHYDPLPKCMPFFDFFDGFSVVFFLAIFFVLTGYFTKAEDPDKCIRTSLLYLGIPYVSFSLFYMLMIWVGQHGFYPIRQQMDLTSPINWLYILSVKTITPYYYLYEVLLFRLIIAISKKYFFDVKWFWIVILSVFIGLDSVGVVIGHWPWLCLGYVMSAFKVPLFWGGISFVPLAVFFFWGCFLQEKTLIKFIYSMNFHVKALWVLSMLSVTGYISGKLKWGIASAVSFVGRNTLTILVMHIFGLKMALIARNITPGESAVVDFILMLLCGVALPIACVKIMDLLKVSQFFFGRKEAFSK